MPNVIILAMMGFLIFAMFLVATNLPTWIDPTSVSIIYLGIVALSGVMVIGAIKMSE